MTSNKQPSERVLRLFRNASAVCFDVDCTITKNDALDDLAEFLGVGEAVRNMTNRAMDGEMQLDDALQQRLDIMEPTIQKLAAYTKSNPAAGRLVPGIRELIKRLREREVEVFLISGGFRELILPLAEALDVPPANIFANRFVYMSDDETGPDGFPVVRVRGFDPNEPTSREGGKPEAIRRIRSLNPYDTIIMVGDGITDLEAVTEAGGGGADLFIGYGGVIERTLVSENADWFITHHDQMTDILPKYKVAMVGSGPWACASLQMISENAKKNALFDDTVKLWVFDEDYKGEKLVDKINQLHENPKYLPGVKFGDNVVASSNVVDVVKDADIIIFCTPHEYVHQICLELQMKIKPSAIGISLIKGMRVKSDGSRLHLISSMVRRLLHIECSVLMGANIVSEIGPGNFCESTIGSRYKDQGKLLSAVFTTEYFNTSIVSDVEGVELCGTLKNIVAIAAGFVDGCNLGHNAKAAIFRQGLKEMRSFAKRMFDSIRDETFYESCGIADVIASSYGGRNYTLAKVFAESEGTASYETLEKQLLNGVKIQGVTTSQEVFTCIESREWCDDFPLFCRVQQILIKARKPKEIATYRK